MQNQAWIQKIMDIKKRKNVWNVHTYEQNICLDFNNLPKKLWNVHTYEQNIWLDFNNLQRKVWNVHTYEQKFKDIVKDFLFCSYVWTK